jgi:hypothetical protein
MLNNKVTSPRQRLNLASEPVFPPPTNSAADGGSGGGTPQPRWIENVLIAVVGTIAAIAYVLLYLIERPPAAPPRQGWWGWFDQGQYLSAAVAWASGDLNPAHHYYLPGYSLLAAPFVALTRANPFVIPDLLCLLATLWLFTAIGGRLAKPILFPRAFSAAIFLVSLGAPPALETWVVPWSTTGSTPLILGCLLAVIRLQERPDHRGAAFLAGLCGGALIAFRPADAAVTLLCGGLAITWLLLRARLGWRRAAPVALAAVLGTLLPAVLVAVSHLAIYGWQLGDYLAANRRLGFEWRLLPLNWVTLILDPRPMFVDGRGLAEVFPWVFPGLVGLAVCVTAPRRNGNRTAHILVAGTSCLYLLLYLAYRGLNPDFLWLTNLHHYFQWVLPVLALYAGLLVHRLLLQPVGCWRAVAVAGAVAGVLLPWRAELTVTEPLPPPVLAKDRDGSGTLLIPAGMSRLDDAVMVAGEGSNSAVLLGEHLMVIGGRSFASTYDFQVHPRRDRLLIRPLRLLPPGAAAVTFAPGVTLYPEVLPVSARQRVVFGLPCWFGMAGRLCQPDGASVLASPP